MARLIHTPTTGGLVGPFEPLVLRTLLDKLPDTYAVASNFQIKQRDYDALEYDFTILAPHAIYVVEAKEWYGRLTGDDTEWLLNQTPRRCALWLVNTKCKVLKTELGPMGNQVYVSPVLVVPDGTENLLGGNWGSHVRSLTGLLGYLQDPNKLPKSAAIGAYQRNIEAVLQGKWGARKRERRRRIGGYEIVDTLFADDRTGEYLAKRALIEGDPTRYRIRTWRLDPNLPLEGQQKQRALIARPTEAVLKIGRHPNLLQVLQFDFVDEDNEYFEVTEWSEFGTLHGYLANKDRGGLTLRERLEIAEGVAAALHAVHSHDVVHRNVCPETIQIGFDRKPRLTDFDRAYIDSKYTVFASSTTRHVDPAYVAPELADATDYDFDTASDMYSFGVLLYRLLADEVPFKDAKAAKAKEGKPEAMPTEKRAGIDPRLDALILKLLRIDDFKARPSAAEALSVLRDVLGLTSAASRKSSPPPSSPRPPPQESFEIGSMLRGVMRIDALLGAGGLGRVYKVFHLDHQKYYALKVLLKADDADLLLKEFNSIRPMLPRGNKHIAQLEWMDRLDPPERLPCLLSEFIDGETLEAYCDGRKELPWTDIKRIGDELLGALVALHPNTEEYERLAKIAAEGEIDGDTYDALMGAKERAKVGLFHRDLKPANVMLAMPDHRAVLIDFNIASLASEQESSGRTPQYCAPDWLTCERASYDLFGLGCVLYELVTHRHPYAKNDPAQGTPYRPREIGAELSEELDEFLYKAVQPSAADRFKSAREMRRAWAAVQSMYAAAAPRSVSSGRFPGIKVTAEESNKKNYNPYVTRLLTLYSQARRSNAGTRGLDEIARLTYVHTKLDKKLAPVIGSGNYRLVLITGNAGDGKTAFLQQVEAWFRQHDASVEALNSGNGSRWSFQSVDYETNYDGSQDEGDRKNDAVLAEFLAPFAGPSLAGLNGPKARLIAINEGRLLDFLKHSEYAERFAGLWNFVTSALDGGRQSERALLVNLNLRAVAAGGADSLVDAQLKAMLNDQLWSPCEECAYAAKCPIKHNVDSMRAAASGPAVRERVRRLFEVVHLRRRAHVTMRDLRSALSYLLLRDHSCDEIGKLLARKDDGVTEDLAWLYYPNAFADVDLELDDEDELEVRAIDRLVRRLRETDVGLVNDPALDRRLDHAPDQAVPWMTFEGRSEEARKVMAVFTRDTPMPGDSVDFTELLARRRVLQGMWRRWAYFERRDDGWKLMLPYRSIELLENIVLAKDTDKALSACEQLRDRVVDAISLSEGVRNAAIRERYLALKITRVKDASLRSYRLFPKQCFHVDVARAQGLIDYLEYAPDAVELVADRGGGVARLRVSLDLLEMLNLIGSGYRPTTQDLQGLFVNLLIFRNELLTTTFDEVLVTTDDREFFRIGAQGTAAGIRLALVKESAPGAPEGTSP